MDSEMKLNCQVVKTLREQRSWSQEHLASAAGLSPRTIQRVEAEGKGSPETCLALAAALQVDVSKLSDSGSRKPEARNPWRGATAGFVCATVGVASAGFANRHLAGADLGVTLGSLGTVYGLICAWVAIYVEQHRRASPGSGGGHPDSRT
jgi:DNA-binding XRE family transcriptional regulator